MNSEFIKLFTNEPLSRKSLAFRKKRKRDKRKSLLRKVLSKSYSIKIEFILWSRALKH